MSAREVDEMTADQVIEWLRAQSAETRAHVFRRLLRDDRGVGAQNCNTCYHTSLWAPCKCAILRTPSGDAWALANRGADGCGRPDLETMPCPNWEGPATDWFPQWDGRRPDRTRRADPDEEWP